jgi:uncharacterized membrane protein YdfJ with MMPL/SSD domain
MTAIHTLASSGVNVTAIVIPIGILAVIGDATVVRGILLPAAMSLLGERCWYLPRWLSWLPGRRHE